MRHLWEKTWFRTLIILLVIGGAMLWEFGPKWSWHSDQQWEGTIQERTREYNYRRQAVEPNAGPEYYDHYWRVFTSDRENLWGD